jgi:flagellar biosynthetic protein FlhB
VANDNKTEQPTPRRRHQAREKGQVARSRELIGTMAAATTTGLLAATITTAVGGWHKFFADALADAAAGAPHLGSLPLAITKLPLVRNTTLAIALGWAVALAAALAQGGLVMAPSSLAPKAERLSPASKLRQLFSIVALGNSLKSLIPVAVIVYLTVTVFTRDWQVLLHLSGSGSASLAAFTMQRMFEITWKSVLVLLAWSGADYLFQRFKFEHDLRMSRQELIDELKETEGHPTIKARIRRLQRQVRRRRMLKDAERATVVITNPSHFAVGLEYRPEMAAPVVVAKGRNLLAAQIKQIARWHGIPVVENPPLAHALYRVAEVGQTIPAKLYAVVAEVLAFVYRTQATQAARG